MEIFCSISLVFGVGVVVFGTTAAPKKIRICINFCINGDAAILMELLRFCSRNLNGFQIDSCIADCQN